MKRKNKPVRFNRLSCFFTFIVTIILLIVTCFGLFAFTLSSPHLMCFGTFFPPPHKMEQQARIQFPESATNIQYEIRETGTKGLEINCTIGIQFEMSPDDFDTFRASTLVDEFEFQQLLGNLFDYRMRLLNWAQPQNSIAGYNTVVPLSPNVSQWIFIDTNHPDSWVVYVISNEYRF